MKKKYWKENLTEEEIKALTELKEILNKNFKIDKLIIYGSKIRGDFDEESDLDVLILVPRLNWKLKESIINKTTEINWKYDTNISPVVVSLDEWKKYPFLPYFQNVKQEGASI